jgi:hypothetical protein
VDKRLAVAVLSLFWHGLEVVQAHQFLVGLPVAA